MIKFPQMSVAQSVVNRILNTRDELRAGRRTQALNPSGTVEPLSGQSVSLRDGGAVPSVPDPTLTGGKIDLGLEQPLGPMPSASADGSNSVSANTLEASLSGGKPLQGVLDGISVG